MGIAKMRVCNEMRRGIFKVVSHPCQVDIIVIVGGEQGNEKKTKGNNREEELPVFLLEKIVSEYEKRRVCDNRIALKDGTIGLDGPDFIVFIILLSIVVM
ncbi:unnamed protein product [Lupinus luteus]|uniref:Uncharacterized protein n=1 Tax=Lupinus luteus TaxID=3873 RepID=A0AAV1X6Q1_LUPLU